MDLSAPGTTDATRVVLLGAGELAKEVVIALQRLGAEVTAVDRYDGAPAHQVAHHAVTATMSDPAALRSVLDAEIARRPLSAERPLLVVPEIEALATDVLVEYEARRDDVRVTPTARAAALTMDREGIRRLAAEEVGVPTSGYRFCDDAAQVAAAAGALGYPCFVKPVVSSSGKGQSVVRSAGDVGGAWDLAMAGGRVDRGRVIVEAAVAFDVEITLLTVRSCDGAGGTRTSFCAPIGHRQEAGDYVESWQPQPLGEVALARSRETALAVTGALGGWGVFGVELFVRDDEVWFSEVSPRPHDTGLVTLATQRQSEFDLHARALLGLPVDTALRGHGASAVLKDRRASASAGTGASHAPPVVSGVDEVLALPGVDLRLFGKPSSHPGRRLGVVLAAAVDGEDVEQLRERAVHAAGLLTLSHPTS